jgi:protocatechuate 3,4-dioxygenase beta subunit
VNVRLSVAAALALVSVVASVSAQAPASANQQTASVAGRITIGGKPAARVMVRLFGQQYDPGNTRQPTTIADEDGRYVFENVAPGQYFVSPYAPGFTGPNQGWRSAGGRVTLAAGEAATGVDVALARGGVVTGRVTDSEGRPVIGEGLTLKAIDESGQKRPVRLPNDWVMRTDDRGVYRLYGVPPGRYLVSVGNSAETGMGGFGQNAGFYPHTFHPNTTTEADATIVTVEGGGEVRGVDISVAKRAPTYAASGRIVDASGSPVPNLPYGFGLFREGDSQPSSFAGGHRADAKGVFRIEGLAPGRYAAMAWPEDSGDGNWFSDTAYFRIDGSDVSGLEIKLHPGATISGTAVVEGASDPAVLAKLAQVRLFAWLKAPEDGEAPLPMQWRDAAIAADGTFRFTGVAPGRVLIGLQQWSGPKGFEVLRLERNGVEQGDGIDVSSGDQIVGLRVVIGYGEGSIRGRVRFEGGARPPDLEIGVGLRRAGGVELQRGGQVDERGQFVLDNLPAGDYEVVLHAWSRTEFKRYTFKPEVKQAITVAPSTPAQAELVVNLGAIEIVEAPR